MIARILSLQDANIQSEQAFVGRDAMCSILYFSKLSSSKEYKELFLDLYLTLKDFSLLPTAFCDIFVNLALG
jgi:hypothetical protein